MKNFSTWMILMFVIMFWAFRAFVAFFGAYGGGFAGVEPLNDTIEVILLFVVLVCVLLIVKRNIIGAFVYLGAYGLYFGADCISTISRMINGESISMGNALGAFMAVLGIILPVAVLLDMLADKARKANPKDKKTDWFYKNEKFDRELDERADHNNYRTL